MTAPTTETPEKNVAPSSRAGVIPSRVGARLPSWAPIAVLLGSIVIGYVILAVAGKLSTFGEDIASGDFGTIAGAIAPGLLVGGLVYILLMWAISYVTEGPRWASDRLARSLTTGAFILVLIPLVTLILMVITEGAQAFGWSFLSNDMIDETGRKITRNQEGGGAWHAIVGTLEITGIAALISIPLGIFTAIYLVEYGGGPVKKIITFLVDVMTGIPSIVAGLFAYSLFLLVAGPSFKAGLIGAVALSVLMTPVVVRSVEEMLKLVPNELREASYALGVPKWLTIVKVVLRTAIAGIVSGIMISIARVIGETAPLLITVGFVEWMNANPFEGRQTTLPVFVYRQYAQGGDANMLRAWAGALTLILIVMLLNFAGRLVAYYFSPKGQSR